MTTVPTRAQGADFARRHHIDLTAELVDATEGAETWRLEAKCPNGILSDTMTTDRSFTPDPFEVFFGVWADELPDDDEYYTAAHALGPDALSDLAALLGWIPA